MTSSRLPGKCLMPLGDKPMLQYLADSLRHALPELPLIVATSDGPSDEPIAAFCERCALLCFRGPLDDVAGRFLRAAEAHALSVFVRLNGDSPLMDAHLVTRALALFAESGADLVTNVFPRSYPKGQSVEVVSVAALRRAYPLMSEAQREHVTQYLYANAGGFSIRNFDSGGRYEGIQLSVDTQEDFDLLSRMIARMTRPHWEYGFAELVALRERVLPGGAP